ncbi:MAG: amino acid permease [Acidobacteriota bacterium]
MSCGDPTTGLEPGAAAGNRSGCERSGLIRSLSTADMTAVGINGVIGAGIFLAPATVARLTGAASTLVYLCAGALVGLVALCFAEAGSRFDRAGGPFLYARSAFGPAVGFQVAWFTWLARMTALAALADGFATYSAYLWPGLDSGWRRAVLLCLLLGGLTFINVLGVRQGARTVNLFTLMKIVPLLIFVAAGAAFVDAERLRVQAWPAVSDFGRAMLFLFYVYGGFEVLTFPAEEVARPQHSIPRAVLATQALVIVVYLAVHSVTLGTLPGLAQDATPVASAAQSFLGRGGGILITIGAIVSIAGCQSGVMLTAPRLLFAVARDERLPGALARVHPRFHTPHLAILTQGAAGLALALVGTFEGMAILSAIARMVTYVSTCLAVLVLRRRDGPAPFTVSGGVLVPLAAIALCIWVTTSGEPAALLAGVAAAGAGCFLYWLGGRKRRAPAPGTPS